MQSSERMSVNALKKGEQTGRPVMRLYNKLTTCSQFNIVLEHATEYQSGSKIQGRLRQWTSPSELTFLEVLVV